MAKLKRFGLVIEGGSIKKPTVIYLRAKTATEARGKFFASARHFRTEANVLAVRHSPVGGRLEVTRKKPVRRRVTRRRRR